MAKDKKKIQAAQKKARQVYLKRQQQKKQKTILIAIISVLVVGVVALLGFFIYQSSTENEPKAETATQAYTDAQGLAHPQFANDDGTIAINNTGLVPASAATGKKIEVVMDAVCPACANFELTYNDKIKAAVDNGKATYILHPVGLLDFQTAPANVIGSNKSRTENYGYSTRGAAAIFSAAEQDPTKIFKFLGILFSSANQPKEQSTVNVENSAFVKYATEAGYTPEQAAIIGNGQYVDWVKKVTEGMENDTKYRGTDGKLNTPQVFVDDQKINPSQLEAAING
jgi:protein-disulfide isomerase